MNYYPSNFYPNYTQYQNGYNQNQMPMQPTSMMQTPAAPQSSASVPGKIVDSVDVARVSDIPFGGYGIFPKADLTEVYIKMWNNNGTTSLMTFRPVIDAQLAKGSDSNDSSDEGKKFYEENYDVLLEKIEKLENKIDELQQQKQSTNGSKRKELNASAY